ncbi:alpha/beta fold hydrolase [Microbacterium saccharophilum]|uniref:Alpha/beta fold hydrolase n=1 Tax=Microbacterium saccharophilum TaxID=1213358 RepID=A0A5C8I4X9_9MICO|nr:alpha/beta hydrolase [Microbacterium saccharophilum]TXK14087.1 alpha/beta fold hydrolase [Microbacterium saccharophilum]
MTRTYRTLDVPVRGGDLRVGVWEDGTPGAPTVVAVHGVTASHLAWQLVAEALPGVRIVAPDLRGRGRSNELSGPAGMAAHADDLAAVFAHLDIPAGLVVGHSMGAFVSLAFAHRHPGLLARLLLVDGGLPLATPPGLSGDELVAAILGPTAERLSMRFPDVAAYLALWRAHPAFAADWTPELEEYLAYDLVPDGGGSLRPATSYRTTLEDTVDLNTGTAVTDALAALGHPTRFLTVPRGLQNEAPGLYSPEHAARLVATYPAVRHERWDDLNHYTVVMSEPGARGVAAVIREELSALG